MFVLFQPRMTILALTDEKMVKQQKLKIAAGQWPIL
jgi:hypothetical protein